MTASLNAFASFGIGINAGSATPLPYPLVNGFAYSYASAQANIQLPTGQNIRFKGWAAINYKAPLEEMKLLGTAQEPIARTIGKQDYQGDAEIYRNEYSFLVAAMGPGFSAIQFNIVINYRSPGMPMITDTLLGCRLISPEKGFKSGDPTGLTVKVQLPHMSQLDNGVPLVPFPLANVSQ